MMNFDTFYREEELRQIQVISFLTASLYIFFYFLDISSSLGEAEKYFIFLHVVIMPCILFTVSYLAYTQKYYKEMIRLYSFAPLFALLVNSLLLSIYQEAQIYQTEIYLAIFWVFTVSGLNYYRAIIIGASGAFVSLICAMLFYDLAINFLLAHMIWLSSALFFGMVGGYLLHNAKTSTYRKHQELELALNNKDILMRETYHRVKNNLQVISSLLAIESKQLKDNDSKELFMQNRQRILSMSLIHEQLYQHDDLEEISLCLFVHQLVDEIKKVQQDTEVEFIIECKNITLNLDKAISLGLVINEIITNSLKYAFKGETAEKKISVKIHQELSKYVILIHDNGKGIDTLEIKSQFGFILIDSLIRQQLKGDFEFFNEDGLSCKITIDTDFF